MATPVVTYRSEFFYMTVCMADDVYSVAITQESGVVIVFATKVDGYNLCGGVIKLKTFPFIKFRGSNQL